MLFSGEWWYQEDDLGAIIEIAHQANLITLWEPHCIGTKEGQDLETLYWLSSAEHDQFLE